MNEMEPHITQNIESSKPSAKRLAHSYLVDNLVHVQLNIRFVV